MVWSLTPGSAVRTSARRNTGAACFSTWARTRSCFVPPLRSAAARRAKIRYAEASTVTKIRQPRPGVRLIVVPVVGRAKECRVVLVGGVRDELLQGDPPADLVPGVDQKCVGQRAGDSAVPVRERMDDEQVEDHQADQQDRVVPGISLSVPVASDEIREVLSRLRRRNGHEPHGRAPVGRPIHDEVVVGLELTTGVRRLGPEQPVQVQQQPDVQRVPILLEQVVERLAVADQLLLASVP